MQLTGTTAHTTVLLFVQKWADFMPLYRTVYCVQSLDLRGSRVHVAGLPCLGSMRQLQRLTVDLRRGGAESVEEMCAALFATCLCCTRLQAVEVVCDNPAALQGMCGEVQRALEDSGRGQVQVVACR